MTCWSATRISSRDGVLTLPGYQPRPWQNTYTAHACGMNIQALARRTGVSAATLRKWEQRYAVLKPERTPGSHRRYSERDALRVEWLKARLLEGYRIGEAAFLLGADTATSPRTAPELVRDLLAATRGRNHGGLARALDHAFALLPTEEVIADVVEPALAEAGELWARGEIQIADEHHLTEVVRGKLHSLLEGVEGGSRGTVVLCCAPGERHECGLLALGLLLCRDGWEIVYLGADTPLADAAAFARGIEARVVCVSATMPAAALLATDELTLLEGQYPEIVFVRGGRGFDAPEDSRGVVASVRKRTAVA
jgi:MerR family transcriptional regulator, light-induced transcriptional regulator